MSSNLALGSTRVEREYRRRHPPEHQLPGDDQGREGEQQGGGRPGRGITCLAVRTGTKPIASR
jgi:hypothetical protein